MRLILKTFKIASLPLAACFTLSSWALPSDGTWLSVSGKISQVGDEYFVLQRGENKKAMTVEMDDWDFYNEAAPLLKGDNVVVYGRMDTDLMNRNKMEAATVFVRGLNTYFYASSIDEESIPAWNTYTYYDVSPNYDEGSWVEITGTVSDIQGREFTVNTGYQTFRVDTSQMAYNPLDDEGYQKIRASDRVRVAGEIDDPFFDRREIEASYIVTLKQDQGPARQEQLAGQ